jgi:Thrombospondin type 3 repeat
VVTDAKGGASIPFNVPESPGLHTVEVNTVAGERLLSQVIAVPLEANCAPKSSIDDLDGDGLANACDHDNSDGPLADADADGVLNGVDNCPLISNVDQRATNSAEVGDVCNPNMVNAVATYRQPALVVAKPTSSESAAVSATVFVTVPITVATTTTTMVQAPVVFGDAVSLAPAVTVAPSPVAVPESVTTTIGNRISPVLIQTPSTPTSTSAPVAVPAPAQPPTAAAMPICQILVDRAKPGTQVSLIPRKGTQKQYRVLVNRSGTACFTAVTSAKYTLRVTTGKGRRINRMVTVIKAKPGVPQRFLP